MPSPVTPSSQQPFPPQATPDKLVDTLSSSDTPQSSSNPTQKRPNPAPSAVFVPDKVPDVSIREASFLLLSYMWPSARLDLCVFSLLSMGLLFFSNIATVAVPVIFRSLVNSLDTASNVPQAEWSLFLLGPSPSLGAYLMLFLLVQLVAILLQEGRSILFTPVSHYASRKLAVDAFAHVQYLGARFHTSRQLGSLSRVIDRAVTGIENITFMVMFNVLPAFIELIMALVVMGALLSWWVAIVVVISIVLYIVTTLSLTEWRMRYRRRMNAADEHANARSTDSLINFETVMYFANEPVEIDRYRESRMKYERIANQTLFSLSALNFAQGLIFSSATVVVVALIGFGVEKGQSSFGDYVMVFSYLSQFYGRLGWLGSMYRMIRQSLTDVAAMITLFHNSPEVIDTPDANPLILKNGSIRFSNVHFAYTQEREILNGLSFELPAGKTLGVVGASGSGKTTITRLLTRLYNPLEGHIAIDDQDVTTLEQSSIRSQIGIVPQETALFNDTLAYNIRYGLPHATDEQVRNAVQAANLDHLVDMLPDGLNTMVGERGMKVSGGERQRIAIARMVLRNPKILVLDEATSSLDTTTEQMIVETIERLFGHRTILIIAHRLSTVANAHNIILLDRGSVFEQGTHAELLTANGRYAQMWTEQSRRDRKDHSEHPNKDEPKT